MSGAAEAQGDGMLRAVLDTNVTAAACFAPDSTSGRIMRRWRAGHFCLIASDPLRGELAHLAGHLARIRAVRRAAECMAATLVEFDVRAEWVVPAPLDITLDDRPDELVLGTAVAGAAAFLVSNDAGLLAVDGYHGIRIVQPRRFFDVLDQPPTGRHP